MGVLITKNVLLLCGLLENKYANVEEFYRPHTSGIIAQGEPPAHAYSNHFHPEEDIEHHDGQTDFSTTEDEEWIDEGEISGSDSFINEEQPPPPRGRRQEYQSRHLRQAPQYYPVRHASSSTPSLDPAEEFGPYGRPYHPQQGGRGGMYPRGPMPPYPQNQGGNYGGYRPNQIIPQNNNYGQNPFSPMNTSNNPGYFGHDHMPMYGNDVMQYPPYYRGPPHAGALPAYMQQFHVSQPNGHPVDQHGALVQQAPTPAESPAPDPERLRLEAELAAFKMQQEKIKQVERHREMEAQIRKDTEEALNRRMDQLRLEQEEHRKELEKARAEAERAARERIEAERKADEERARQHAEAMRQAEEKARMKFEAEMKAAEAKRKREEEDRKRAEEAAKIRLEAAIRAEADARAAAEKKAKEEMDRLKAIQEEAKRKAEADALAKVEAEKEAERKRKEAEEVAKKEHEALKKKIQEETKAKLEEAAKNTADKAPIKFKDALGRKFSFPYHLCSRWQVSPSQPLLSTSCIWILTMGVF